MLQYNIQPSTHTIKQSNNQQSQQILSLKQQQRLNQNIILKAHRLNIKRKDKSNNKNNIKRRQSRHSFRDFYATIRRDNSTSLCKNIQVNKVQFKVKQNNYLIRPSLSKTQKSIKIYPSSNHLSTKNITSQKSIKRITKLQLYNPKHQSALQKQQQYQHLRLLHKSIFPSHSTKNKKPINLIQFGIFSQRKHHQQFLSNLKRSINLQFNRQIDTYNDKNLLKLQFVILKEIHKMGGWIQ